MPLYEYKCKKCHHRFERIQKFSDPHVKKCPDCGGPVEQLLSAPAVQFKGSGWYVTDYAGKTSGDPDKPASGATETASKGAETKETGSKDSKEKKSAKKK